MFNIGWNAPCYFIFTDEETARERRSWFAWVHKFQMTSQDFWVFFPTHLFCSFLKAACGGGGQLADGDPRLAVCEVTTVLATGMREEDGRAVFSPLSLASLCSVTFAFPPSLLPLPCQRLGPLRDIPVRPHIRGPLDCHSCHRTMGNTVLSGRGKATPPRPVLLIHNGHTTSYMFKMYNRMIQYLWILPNDYHNKIN